MRPLRYSINVTLDGSCDHTAMVPNASTHAHSTAGVARADAIILGRITYQLMEDGWRDPDPDLPPWVAPFAETITRSKKYVVSSTLPSVDWTNAELLTGDLRSRVEELKSQPGDGLAVGGMMLPLALAEWGLIDEYEFIVFPPVAGHGPYLLGGLPASLNLTQVDRFELDDGVAVLRFAPAG